MKIKYLEKNLELYDSATFLTLGLGETEVVFGDEAQGETITVILDFIDDGGNSPVVSWETINNNKVKGVLTNWNSSLATTLAEPFTGGTLFNRDLVFNFSVSRIGKDSEARQVTFSVYLGQEVNNG